MKAGDVFVSKLNERVGLILEAHIGNKFWNTQSVDIIDNRKVSKSYIFEKAHVNNINRFYNLFNRKREN